MNKKILISVSIIIIIIIGVVSYILLTHQKNQSDNPSGPVDISINDGGNTNNPSPTKSPSGTPAGDADSLKNDDGDLYYSPDSGVVSLHERTRSEITDTLVRGSSSLQTSSGKPNFNIISVKRIDQAWYVVKIVNSVDPTVGVAWVILKDNGDNGGLSIYAGPGTSFIYVDLPDSVRKAIK